MRRIQIFVNAYDLAVDLHDQLEDDQEMIAPYQFGQLMVDWTSPAKASYKYVHLFSESLLMEDQDCGTVTGAFHALY